MRYLNFFFTGSALYQCRFQFLEIIPQLAAFLFQYHNCSVIHIV
ncbi:hypothetical protein DBV15_09903 [Temnothorax longispinosus]|uniref:Uncharacterized protein n=1 Tax=Temnothorax longispinosus TaxID=300112 RepID=A0A4V3S9T1_9HYME|nr:hypothetical protein DBV15_09903 [Temnothorax longispinosus]